MKHPRAIFLSYLNILVVGATSNQCTNAFQQPQHGACWGSPTPYTVKPSNGKGLGMFAAQELEVGDIVLQEVPVLKIVPPKTVRGAGYPQEAITALVALEFKTLTPAEQHEVMTLTYHVESPEEEATADKLGVIFRTNAYTSGDEVGLFPKIARINHSCRPNLSYYWSTKLNKRIVYATRPINKGEEFFVSYIPLLLTRNDRQQRLNRYGFTCTCEACAQHKHDQEASDDRRTTLSKAFKDFEPQLTLTPPKSVKARQQARKNARASVLLTELVHQEQLADYYAKAYRVAAISHARVEQWEPAAIWANKGYELKFREDPDSPYTMELHNMTSNFIAHWEQELRQRTKPNGP